MVCRFYSLRIISVAYAISPKWVKHWLLMSITKYDEVTDLFCLIDNIFRFGFFITKLERARYLEIKEWQ